VLSQPKALRCHIIFMKKSHGGRAQPLLAQLPVSRISSVPDISTAAEAGTVLWQVVVFAVSLPFGKWRNAKMPFFPTEWQCPAVVSPGEQ